MIITATLTEGTVVSITNGRHTWRTDEPPDKGGTDLGPTPYEQLVGSLASCICVTLALYSRTKGIPLQGVTATVEHDRIHAEDCEDCDKSITGFINRMRSNVEIRGTFTDDQRQRLKDVATRCPVHKTLENPVKLIDQVAFV